MHSHSRLLALLLVLSGLVWAPRAHGDVLFSYSGSTTFGPTFTRPPRNDNEPTAAQRNVSYNTRSFQVAANTNCIVDGVQNGSFDGVLYIYRGGFDPQSPTQNLAASGDDGQLGVGTTHVDPFSVTANTPMIIVTAAFSNQTPSRASGTFQNTITCNEGGAVVLSPDSPEPAAATNVAQPPGQCPISQLPACVGTPTVPGRFSISVVFSTFQDATVRQATPAPFGSGESALFSFFQPSNFEVLVKVLNFCAESVRTYRVFAAGMTDVNVTVTVTDTLKGGAPIVIQNVTPNRFNFQERDFPQSSCS